MSKIPDNVENVYTHTIFLHTDTLSYQPFGGSQGAHGVLVLVYACMVNIGKCHTGPISGFAQFFVLGHFSGCPNIPLSLLILGGRLRLVKPLGVRYHKVLPIILQKLWVCGLLFPPLP